jgi:arginine:pyruvate transaminase
MRAQYQKRRDLVCARLAQMPRVKYLKPESGMFIMVDISPIYKDDKEFAQKLLDTEKLSVLPGSAFGEGTTGHVRLSLVQPENILTEGCNRLERFLQASLTGK